jgi:sec-independent protein translocase protein TatA
MVFLDNYILQIPLGLEWIILIVVVVLVFFGVKKIPELARNFGKASVEYKKARIEAERGVERLRKQGAAINEEREKLEQVAGTLGIDYIDMTDDEIRKAIETEINKAKKSPE